MESFTRLKGVVVPLDRANIDTDQIIPKQFLKRIERTGFGQFLFFDWRFLDDGSPNEGFELNKPRYKGASILLARDNFGSGSSREHAPWALKDYGIQVIIAPSFADIFFNNCFKNGMLPIVLPTGVVDELFKKTQAQEGYELEISLESQTITDDSGWSQGFEVDEFKKRVLLEGLDDIDLTMQLKDKIEAYEKKMEIA